MRGNLKVLGLALVAVLALGAVGASGSSAAENHQFHSDGEFVDITGKNITTHELAVGTAGVVKCTGVTTEGTEKFNFVSSGTYDRDTITVKPHYSGCTFGGNAATVNFEHCAYVYDSDTTTGNPTEVPPGSGLFGEHANIEIECEAGNSIKIATTVCTLTIGPQVIKHAAKYENDPSNTNAIIINTTAHSIVLGNLNDKGGCVLMPKGAIGKWRGETTFTCYQDFHLISGTEKTTPTGLLQHGAETNCHIKKGTAS